MYRAIQAAANLNVAPIAQVLRKRILNMLRKVSCNGEQAYTTSFLTSVGPALPVLTSWAAWSTQVLKLKYWASNAKVQQKEVATDEVAFGVVQDGSTGSFANIVALPVFASAAVPGTRLFLFSFLFPLLDW